MAYIKINLDKVLMNGHEVSFIAPCDCTAIEGLKVCYVEGEELKEKIFTMKDAHGNTLTGLGNLFKEGAYVHAILDSTHFHAYIQNADTNGYLEARFQEVFQLGNNAKAGIVDSLKYSNLGITEESTWAEIEAALASEFSESNLILDPITTSIKAEYTRGEDNQNKAIKYAWYDTKYDLTDISALTITYNYYYLDPDSDVGDVAQKYFYNAFKSYVGVSSSNTDKSTSDVFEVENVFEVGSSSYETTMSGTKTVTLDVSDLSGEYYIGCGASGRNTSTDGTLYDYNDQAQYVQIVNVAFTATGESRTNTLTVSSADNLPDASTVSEGTIAIITG
jgi:hypothetical protein